MTAPQITPGPWVAETDDGQGYEGIYSPAYPGRPIAKTVSYWQGPGPRKPEREANAIAIAAVPKMVEALVFVCQLNITSPARAKVEDALRAAGILPQE